MQAHSLLDAQSPADILRFLHDHLDQLRVADRHRLLQKIRRLQKTLDRLTADSPELNKLVEAFASSAAIVAERRAGT